METYLTTVTNICREILKDELIGLYAQGSVALEDFQEGLSDFDLLGVVANPLSPEKARALADALDHSRNPCPAEGLELVLVTQKTARQLKKVPRYEMWLYTGEEWRSELELRDYESELLIFFSILLQCGRTLLGPTPNQVFARPPREWVLQAMHEVLEFHVEKQLDQFWDPMGRNSVLNACRCWRYADTGQFTSKGGGGEWVLQRGPWPVVRDALENRPVDEEQARQFVLHVLGLLRQQPIERAS